MAPDHRSWLPPVASSVAVAALVGGLGVLLRPSPHGAGPGPDHVVVGPERPRPSPDPLVDSGPPRPGGAGGHVEVTGYQSRGRLVDVFFQVDPGHCVALGGRPRVAESAAAVRLRLPAASEGPTGPGCAQVDRSGAVTVRLARPLDGRLVKDDRRGGALVPLLRAVP